MQDDEGAQPGDDGGAAPKAATEDKTSVLGQCTCECQEALGCSCAEQSQCRGTLNQALARFARAHRDGGTRKLASLPTLTAEQRAILASKYDVIVKAIATLLHQSTVTGAIAPFSPRLVNDLKRLRAAAASARNALLAATSTLFGAGIIARLANLDGLEDDVSTLCELFAQPAASVSALLKAVEAAAAQLDAYGF